MITQNEAHLPVMEHTYSAEEAAMIRKEADEWVLLYERSAGNDYGGDQYSDMKWSTREEIDSRYILVRDGHFSGVIMTVEGNFFNRWSNNYRKIVAVEFTDDENKKFRCAHGGTSFSSDDHSSWDTYVCYLVPKDYQEEDSEFSAEG